MNLEIFVILIVPLAAFMAVYIIPKIQKKK